MSTMDYGGYANRDANGFFRGALNTADKLHVTLFESFTSEQYQHSEYTVLQIEVF